MESFESSSILVATALAIVAIVLCKWIGSKGEKRRPPLPPGPVALPLVGCLFQMLKNKSTARWMHKIMHEMNTEIACVHLGRTHVIPVTSPELAREFLRTNDAILASRPCFMSARVTSNGYLTILSPLGEQWKKMRRVLVVEVLSQVKHQWLHGKRAEEADHLVRYIYNQCQNSSTNAAVNVRTAAQHYCGNVIRKMVFGKRFFGKGMEDGGPGVEEREHINALFTILAKLYGMSISDYFPWLETFDFDGCKGSLTNAINIIKWYHDQEIYERIEMWKDGRKNKEEDILDVFINLKDSNKNSLLTFPEIQAQIIEIMIAVVDNPSNATEWAMAEMINQPELRKRATQELDEVVGTNRLVQESDLPRLNFIKACAKEAFRLHPMALFNPPHVSVQDTVVGGYFIPKGSHVVLSRPGLGRNHRIWEDALKYKPERHIQDHTTEVSLVDHELHMLSFSTGRRGCPGILLGSTLTTMLLARLIQGFAWSAPGDELIDLAESDGDMFLAKPLLAVAKPRLHKNVYLQLYN